MMIPSIYQLALHMFSQYKVFILLMFFIENVLK